MELKGKTVGGIVAENFATADVFRKYGVDFCCDGGVDFEQACRDGGVDEAEISGELMKAAQAGGGSIDFSSFPDDLLLDYVLKIHHRGIRNVGPDILNLFNRVIARHGEQHPELEKARGMVADSLDALGAHLTKEEQVLFPYLYRLFDAARRGEFIEVMHCGSVHHPIGAMMDDHSAEGERYKEIKRLLGGYEAPADACDGYRLLLEKVKRFEYNLNEHIHLENNIIFPHAEAAETRWVMEQIHE